MRRSRSRRSAWVSRSATRPSASFPFPGSAPAEEVDYRLADEAVADGSVVVEEISESGSVPTLQVTNKGQHRVLFLEGEELRGAKQNRVLNTSVLIGAMTKATIPVSCVEQGRWRFRTKHFTPSDSYSSSKLRHHLKKSVSDSLQAGRGPSFRPGGRLGRSLAPDELARLQFRNARHGRHL